MVCLQVNWGKWSQQFGWVLLKGDGRTVDLKISECSPGPWLHSVAYLPSCSPFRNWPLPQEVCLVPHKRKSTTQINVGSPSPHHPQSICALFLMFSPNVLVLFFFQNPILSSLLSLSWSYIMAWFLALVPLGIWNTGFPHRTTRLRCSIMFNGRGVGIRLAWFCFLPPQLLILDLG